MTATTHALVGGIIASSLPNNPELALPIIAMSHPVLDMIPHWDFGLGWRKKSKFKLFVQSSLDLLFGIVLTFLIFGKTVDHIYLLSAIFLSEIWDLLFIPYLLLNWKFFPFSFFYDFGHHTNKSMKLPWGIITQALTITGFALAFRFVR